MPNHGPKEHKDIHEKKEKEPHKGQPIGQNIHVNQFSGNTPYGKDKKHQGIKPAGQHERPIINWSSECLYIQKSPNDYSQRLFTWNINLSSKKIYTIQEINSHLKIVYLKIKVYQFMITI